MLVLWPRSWTLACRSTFALQCCQCGLLFCVFTDATDHMCDLHCISDCHFAQLVYQYALCSVQASMYVIIFLAVASLLLAILIQSYPDYTFQNTMNFSMFCTCAVVLAQAAHEVFMTLQVGHSPVWGPNCRASHTLRGPHALLCWRDCGGHSEGCRCRATAEAFRHGPAP